MTKAATAKAKLTTERAALIDELGQLEQDLAPMKAKEKLAAGLRAQVRGWYENLPAEQTATAEGFKFIVTVGECENQRSINSMEEVLDRVGSHKFLDACSLTLKKLAELVTPPDFEKLTTQTRTGARPVATFARSRG